MSAFVILNSLASCGPGIFSASALLNPSVLQSNSVYLNIAMVSGVIPASIRSECVTPTFDIVSAGQPESSKSPRSAFRSLIGCASHALRFVMSAMLTLLADTHADMSGCNLCRSSLEMRASVIKKANDSFSLARMSVHVRCSLGWAHPKTVTAWPAVSGIFVAMF